MTQLRVATYHRVSTADQDPSNARDELRAAVKRRRAKLVLEIEETASAAFGERPGLREVMTAAKRGKIDAVLVWKLDRFGRSVLDLHVQLQTLQACGVRLISTTQALDIGAGGDAMSGLVFAMLAALAEYERTLISERTRAGLRRAERQGRKSGRPVLPRPDARKVAAMRNNGTPWATVASRLNSSIWRCQEALRTADRSKWDDPPVRSQQTLPGCEPQTKPAAEEPPPPTARQRRQQRHKGGKSAR